MIACRTRVTLTVLLAALALAGCGTAIPDGGSAAHPGARATFPVMSFNQAVRDVGCPRPGADQKGVPLPAGFIAQAAIRCVYADLHVPGQGLWQFELKQVAYQGMTRLTAALKRPSVPTPADIPCAAPLIGVQPFVLRARDGQVIAPRLPTEVCGSPQRPALVAVRGLHWVTVASRRQFQVETQPGLNSGCPSGWKDMLGALASLQHGRFLRGSRGGPVFSARPSWLRICTYRDRSGPYDTYLTGGGRVSGATETALLQGIAGGRAAATCPRPHDMVAVLLAPQAGMNPAYVEIGGCHRVLRPDNRIGQASTAALAIIEDASRG